MKTLMRTAALTMTLALVGGAASAGCNPACSEGQTCRYEAAGGKYYCEANSFKSGSGKMNFLDRFNLQRQQVKVQGPSTGFGR